MTADAEPGAAVAVCYGRGILELARGRDREALAAFVAAERVAGRLNAPDLAIPRARALQVLVLVRLGDTERAGQILAGLDERDRERCDVRVETAGLLLARDDPSAAVAALAMARSPAEPLSGSELRVLRYLPTNLTAPEIAGELYVSVNTIKTHVGNAYAKLGAHRRAEVVTRACDLGLLAPSASA